MPRLRTASLRLLSFVVLRDPRDVGRNARFPRAPKATVALLTCTVAWCVALRWYGLSWWSVALSLGTFSWVLGFMARSWREATRRHLYVVGAFMVFAPLVVRLALVRGSAGAQLKTLPGGGSARLLTRIYPESDGALAAAWFLRLTHGMRDPEAEVFADILRRAYARATPAVEALPTPAITTYLGLQSPSAFDTLVIPPPPGGATPSAAAVFLHGYAGNFYVYCWEFAQAAGSANLVTLCPSMAASGAWWTERGRQTLEVTLDYARQRGLHRIYLAGLSNGAAGASVLSLSLQRKLSGLVLISGVRGERAPLLPTLVVQGSSDQMMPAHSARAYTQRNPSVRYREFEGGHLIFLSRYERVRPVIASFLTELEAKRATNSAVKRPDSATR